MAYNASHCLWKYKVNIPTIVNNKKKKAKEEMACCVEAIIFYLAKIVGAMYPTQPLP